MISVVLLVVVLCCRSHLKNYTGLPYVRPNRHLFREECPSFLHSIVYDARTRLWTEKIAKSVSHVILIERTLSRGLLKLKE